MATYKELMRMRDEGQAKIDVICRTIHHLQEELDAVPPVGGEIYRWARLSLEGEMLGLRKALCLFFDWSFEEAEPGGRVEEYLREWADVPRETSEEA